MINDGSTDNTQEALAPYLNKIRYIYQDNQGAGEARNRGLDLARGELIAFLDADDLFLPDKLKEQVAVFDTQPDIGIVNSGFRVIKENGDAVMDVKRWQEIPELTPEVWLLHKPVLPSAMMFRREWFELVGRFEQRFFPCEDIELTLRMIIKGCQSTWLPSITACYRRYNGSATSINRSSILKLAASAEKMQDYFFSRSDLPESMRKLENLSRFYHFSWLAWLCYQSGLTKQMVEYLEKSQNCAPYSWLEIIVNWINTFESCAEIYACDFEVYALTNLKEWQQVVANLKALPLLKNYEPAIRQTQQLLAYQPDKSEIMLYAQAYYQLAQKIIAQNDLDSAITWLRKAIELNPNNCLYYQALGRALKDKYELEEAIAVCRKAVRLEPTNAKFQQNLKEALQLQNRWLELTSYCDQNLRNNNNKTDKKILMIFPFPPYPPQKGGAAIRMFEQIKYFGSRHHLTVVALIFSEADYVIEEQLAPYCERAFMVKLGTPMSAYQAERHQQLYFLQSWNMWKTLEQLSQIDFDLVFFEFIVSTVYYSLFSDRLTILNEHNIESTLLKRCSEIDSGEKIVNFATEVDAAKPFLNAEREARLLAEYENKTWCKFSLRSVVSQEDKQQLDSRCQIGQTIVVKNGVDTKTIVPVDNRNASKILFMGTMNYFPNIDAVLYFVEVILPLIRQENENVFCIAGREPPAKIRELAKFDTSIEVIADPKDMTQVAKQSQMTVVPLRFGSGTRIKILHSMAMGLPVVSTSLGCEGLEVIDGKHLLIRDDPQEFAEAIIAINSNFNLREKLKHQARQLVEAQYNWQSIFAEYERQIWQITSKH